MISLNVESKKKRCKRTNLYNRNRLTNLENKLMVSRAEGWEGRTVRELGIDMYTLLHLKWITNKDLFI